MRLRQLAACACLYASMASCSYASLNFGPDFDGLYTGASIGTPDGLPSPAGGLTLLAGNPNTLLIGGRANMADGAIYSVPLIRDAGGHITGFAGPATFFASAPQIDGGLAYGPDGVLFYTRFNVHTLAQIKPGSDAADRQDIISGFGQLYSDSVGSIAFVPEGFAGAGELKAVTFQNGSFGTIPLTHDGSGTYEPGTGTFETSLTGGPEGIAYVKGTNPGFGVDSLLVAEYTSGKVGAYDLDEHGNPIADSRRDFITGLTSVEGAFVDPLTGDFLFSTFYAGSEVYVVRGFSAPGVVPEANSIVVWLTLSIIGVTWLVRSKRAHRKVAAARRTAGSCRSNSTSTCNCSTGAAGN